MEFNDVRLKGFSKRIKLHEAIDSCLKTFSYLPEEDIDLKTTSPSKRILTRDVYAKRSNPPFTRSAMDGYAVRAADTTGASESNPLTLKLIGKLEIGQVLSLEIEQGNTLRIPTGGVMPRSADAVIMIEDTTKISGGREIEIYTSVHPGKNVSHAGEDIRENSLLLRAGRRLKPVDRAFLLSAGISTIKTSCIPKVAILSTGNELVEAWVQNLELGKTPDVNSLNLYEMCREEGWKSIILGIIPDDESSLKRAITQATPNFDAVILSGGSSVGEKDYIPLIINELGKLVFHGIAMRPGGPTCAAQIDNTIVFGLPGFPTAALITFHFIVRPVLLSLMGLSQNYLPLTVQVKVTRNVGSTLGRLDLLRVRLERTPLGEILAVPIQIGASGVLRSIVDGTGIVLIPEASEGLKEGDVVEAIVWGSDMIDFSPLNFRANNT